jgi:hypothetical protein
METELRAVNSQAIESMKYNLEDYVEGIKQVMQDLKSRSQESSMLNLSKAQVDWYTSIDIINYQKDFFTTCLGSYFEDAQTDQIEKCVMLIHGYEALLAQALLGISIQVIEEEESPTSEHSVLALDIIGKLIYFRMKEFYPQHLVEVFQDKTMQPTLTQYCCFSLPNITAVERVYRFIEQLYTTVVISQDIGLFSKHAKMIDKVCQKHLSILRTEVQAALAAKEVEINDALYALNDCHTETTPLLSTTMVG